MMLLCTDVIEHIDEKDADWVLKRYFLMVRSLLLLTIACYEALKTFKDGRNVHVNIKNSGILDRETKKTT